MDLGEQRSGEDLGTRQPGPREKRLDNPAEHQPAEAKVKGNKVARGRQLPHPVAPPPSSRCSTGTKEY